MKLETDKLENGVVKFLVDIIGHRLAKDKRGRPNVIIAYPSDGTNDKGLKPDLPFMTVHVQNSATPFGWVLDKFVDEDDNVCYQIAFQVSILLEAYGKGSHDIVTELKQRLEFDGNRDLLESYTGTRLYDSGNIPNNYDYLNTDFTSCTPLLFSVVLNSVLVDQSGGLIEKIIVDGELKYSELQTIPEYTLHIEAP